MGQSSSLTWCCCDRNKRASSVLDDSLQEKLLNDDHRDDETAKTMTHDSPATDSERLSRKQSSPRTAHVTSSGMMSLGVESVDDGSDGRTSRDRMDEEDDGESPRNGVATSIRSKQLLSSSYQSSRNDWDLTRESAFGIEQLEMLPSDRHLGESVDNREEDDVVTRLDSVTSRDSYASTREILETTREGDEDDDEIDNEDEVDAKAAAAQEAILRRRSLVRPSSSRVFDDDDGGDSGGRMSSQSSTSRGLRELAEQDAESETFGSYGSDASSMHSFLTRHSDVDSSGLSLVESVRMSDGTSTVDGDTDDAKVPTSGSRSPRHSGSKKRGKKRR